MSSTELDHPPLTPQFCFNQTALRDFLRLSRAATDDTITQNLNALSTPSTTSPFNPSTTSNTQRSTARRLISGPACATFKSILLFPSWQRRSDILAYCAQVATLPDPADPNSTQREMQDARVVDQRQDPYSGRGFSGEARTDVLAALVRNERMVERIVRARTWSMIGEKCEGAGSALGWEGEMEEWRRRRESGTRNRVDV